jgi:hypothetical protein
LKSHRKGGTLSARGTRVGQPGPLGSFASISPCPLPRPLFTLPDIAMSDRDPSVGLVVWSHFSKGRTETARPRRRPTMTRKRERGVAGRFRTKHLSAHPAPSRAHRRIKRKNGRFWSCQFCRTGAPRPMKMGTTASPWRYEVAAADAIRPDNQRRTAILRYALWAAVFPISRLVWLPFGCGHLDQSQERRDGPDSEVRTIHIFIGRRDSEVAPGTTHGGEQLMRLAS